MQTRRSTLAPTQVLSRHRRPFLFMLMAFGLLLAMAASLRAQYGEMNFGYGQGVQLVDPDGSNGAPFWSIRQRTDVSFTIYAMEPARFLATYRQQDPYSSIPLDTTGLPVEAKWLQSFAGDGKQSGAEMARLPSDQIPSGIYIIEAVHRQERATSLIVVTPYTLVTKQAVDGQVLVWATQLQSQTAVVDMQVTLYDIDGNVLSTAKTDGDGLARFDVGNGQPWMAVGEKGETLALVGLEREWRSNGSAWFSASALPDHQVYLYTDRPIYRPGHTIAYNAFARRHSIDGYLPLAASTIFTATLRDARNNIVASQSLAADAYGAVNGAFSLDDEPPLGTYNVMLTDGEQQWSRSLEVEEYRKPEYEVTVLTPADHVISGDPMPITVEADYFFGQPVAGAEVELKIVRRQRHAYGWWWYEDGPAYADGEVAELRGTLDDDGRWTTEYTPDAIDGLDALYLFTATVTDARELPVTARHAVNVHWNAFDLNVSTARYGYQAGEQIAVNFVATQHDGTPHGGGQATVRILEYRYDHSERTDAVPPQTVTIGTDGRAQVTFNGVARGWYRIEASSVDERSRNLLAYTYLWVYGGSGAWWYTSSDEVSLLLDRESYAPGDTARLLIQSRIQGVALLTAEAEGIYDERIVALDGPVTAVDMPVKASYAPNVELSLHIFAREPGDDPYQLREGRLVTAKTKMVVPANDKRLSVQVSHDAERYLPGDTARITVRLTNAAGQPTAGRVSLAVVDEAIFALSEDKSGDIFSAFYGPRYNRVGMTDSLVRNPHMHWYAPTLAEDDGPPAPTATAEPAPRATAPQPRSVFKDTAYWNPTIDVNGGGIVTVDVALPDNLTTWRIVARAITQETDVGEATDELLVTQEIIARPALPRFAVLGDQFEAGLVGQNFSGGDTSGSASLASDALVLLDGGPRAVAMPNGGTAVARWSAVASEPGEVTVLASLSTAAGNDSVELPFPVQPFAVPERISAAGQANPEATETFVMPFNAVGETSDLTVRLSPSVALGVLDGLDELIDFPYGCVEQTMSRVLPSAVAARTYRELGIPNPRADELPKIIEQGLQKLYGFQHSNGAWGWFYDDEGGVYLTSYVIFGLIQVPASGFDIDEGVLDNGLGYLNRHLNEVDNPGTLAYALYVKALAGDGDGERTRSLFNDRQKLDAAGLAFLALTLNELGDGGAAQQATDSLLALVEETTALAFWPAPSKGWDSHYWRSMTSTEKNTALAVQTLAKLRPDDGRLSKAVRWLMSHRRGAGWSNTQATAFAVLGLTDYIRLSGELTSNYAYTVELNGKAIAGGRVTPDNVTEPIAPIIVPGRQLRVGPNELRIAHDGGELSAAQLVDRHNGMNPLYYAMLLRQSLYYDTFTPVSSSDQGVSLKRSYRLHEGPARPNGAYEIGDVVEVRLELDARDDMWYVMVQDPIPAGFEAIAERLNPVTYGPYYEPFRWFEWGYNRKDLRDDRVDFFITHLWPGQRTLSYLMRATTPGIFSVLPGQVYPMYNEDIWGRTGSAQVKVAPDRLAARPELAGDFDYSCAIGDFDLRLAASAWGTSNGRYDLTTDGFVDLADLAAVGARRGANCRADQPLPGASSATPSIRAKLAPTAATIGQQLSLPIGLNGMASPSGFALTVRYNPSHLRVADLSFNPALKDSLTLGPVIDAAAGEIHLGGYDLPTSLSSEEPVVTVRFAGIGVGTAWAEVKGAQVTDGQGRMALASVDVRSSVYVDGEQTFLPLITKQ